MSVRRSMKSIHSSEVTHGSILFASRRIAGSSPAATLGEYYSNALPLPLRQHAVLLEPGGHLVPAVVRCFLAVARPVIGMEAMRRARIDLEFGGLAGGLEGGFHLLDLIDWDALVLGAIEAEHRLLHVLGGSKRVDRHGFVRRIRKTAVEGDAGLEVAVGRIAPHGAAAAAEAHDAEPVGVAALRLRPRDGGVEIGKQLLIGLGV